MGHYVRRVTEPQGIARGESYSGAPAFTLHPGFMSQNKDDDSIIRRVLEGNINDFEILLQRYDGYVFAIVARHVPGDSIRSVAHEAFVRAYTSLPDFKGDAPFRHWLAGITVRSCYAFWREKYRAREVPMSTLGERHEQWLHKALGYSATAAFDRREAARWAEEILDYALSRMSPKDRIVTSMLYLEGLSVKEAAEQLGWSAINVRVRAHRARARLRRVLLGLSAGRWNREKQ